MTKRVYRCSEDNRFSELRLFFNYETHLSNDRTLAFDLNITPPNVVVGCFCLCFFGLFVVVVFVVFCFWFFRYFLTLGASSRSS